MQSQLPDDYGVEYIFDTRLSLRPPKNQEECVETMVIYATVFRVDREGGQVGTSAYEGRAIHNPDDVFSIRLGKAVALGRALKKLRIDEEARERGRRTLELTRLATQ